MAIDRRVIRMQMAKLGITPQELSRRAPDSRTTVDLFLKGGPVRTTTLERFLEVIELQIFLGTVTGKLITIDEISA